MKSKKFDYALNYLLAHPEEQAQPGRTLELLVATPYGTIAYRTWNDAKREAATATRVDKVTVDFQRRTVTDPSGKVTALDTLRAGKLKSPRQIELFYRAAGYTVVECTARRGVMVKRVAVTLAQEAA